MAPQLGTAKERLHFPSHTFLSTIGEGRQFVSFKKNAKGVSLKLKYLPQPLVQASDARLFHRWHRCS
jgi:hypothetical protein